MKNSNDSFGGPKEGAFHFWKQDEAVEQRTEQNRAAEVSHETTEGRGKRADMGSKKVSGNQTDKGRRGRVPRTGGDL